MFLWKLSGKNWPNIQKLVRKRWRRSGAPSTRLKVSGHLLRMCRNGAMEQIVNKVTAKLLSMLDPTGIMAVINSAIALYKAIQSFLKYLREMLQVVNSFVEGVVEIASGNTQRAADFLENSLHRAMPVVIGFLANQVGLGGIGHQIGELIKDARKLVDEAITWL